MILVAILLAAILITLLGAWYPVGIALGAILGLIVWVMVAALISEALGGGEGTTAALVFVPIFAAWIAVGFWVNWGNPKRKGRPKNDMPWG